MSPIMLSARDSTIKLLLTLKAFDMSLAPSSPILLEDKSNLCNGGFFLNAAHNEQMELSVNPQQRNLNPIKLFNI